MGSIAPVTDIAFKNVLFVTDFSSSSDLALPYAVALAAEYAGKIYIAHVIAPQMYEFVPPDFVPQVAQQITAYAKRRMERFLKDHDFQGVPHEVLLEEGEIWETLRRVSDAYGIDVLAVGTKGRRGLEEVLMGSVAEEIIRLAHRPVLTVGPESCEIPVERRPRTILLANDFSLNCARAVACADSLAQRFRARLISVHVSADVSQDPETVTRLEQFFAEKLQQSLPESKASQNRPEHRVDFGVAGERILKIASECSADLIVMGACGAGSPARRTAHFGTTAYRVVSEARCPVLTVRG